MNLFKKSSNLIKFAAFIMALIVVVGVVPAYADFTPKTQEATANPEAYNLMPIYQWHRVDSQKDLPAANVKVPILVIYNAGGNNYFGNGTYTEQVKYDGDKWDSITASVFPKDAKYYPDPFDNSTPANSFFSLDTISDWTMMLTGSRDGKNGDAYKARIWQNGNLISGYDDWDWEGNKDSASHDQWTIMTREVKSTDYSKNIAQNRVKIFHEVSGTDVGFEYTGNHMFGYEDSTYNYDQFVLYWGEILYVSEITEDYIIRDGMVMNIDDGVILKDGVTLKVMPGGVLSIEGQFYNNGTIENHGTVIIQPNSCVTSFMPKAKTAGAIINTGEKIDTKADAQNNIKEKNDLKTKLKSQIVTFEEELANAKSVQFNSTADKETLLHAIPSGSSEDLSTTLTRLSNEIEYELSELEKLQEQGVTDSAISEYKETHVTPLVNSYNEKYAPIAALESLHGVAVASEASIRAGIETANKTIERLDDQIKELNILANSNTNVNRFGEGNLLVMENARLGFEDEAVLTIKDGGSCICNGYIVHPNMMNLLGGKLHIREKGALILEHHFTKNILNFAGATVSNKNTLNISFSGLDTTYTGQNYSIYCSGSYKLIVDGVLKYNGNPIYSKEEGITAVKEGRGVWSRTRAPYYDVSPDGSITEKDDWGNTTTTKLDGSIIYYESYTGVTTELDANGVKKITAKDGTKNVYYPNGGTQEYFASGLLKSEHMQYETYRTDYDYFVGEYEIIYGDIPGPNGEYAKVIYPQRDNMYELMFKNDYSIRKAYDKSNNWLYDCTTKWVSVWNETAHRRDDVLEMTRTYADRVEVYRDNVLVSTTPIK